MLIAIKQKIKGWVAYTIIAIIIVPFALFGINQYMDDSNDIIVATVGNIDINKNEYLIALERSKRALQEQLKDKYNQQAENALKINIINSIINEKLLINLNRELNLTTLNAEVKEQILNNKNFFDDNKFSLEKYKNILRINGYNIQQYEQLVKNNLTNIQIKDNLKKSYFLTKYEKKQLNNLLYQQRKISYIKSKNTDFSKQASITDKEVRDFYQKNKDKFNLAATIKVNFITLDLMQIAKNIQYNEDDIAALYEEEKANFTTQEKRQAQHILLSTKKQAEELILKIKNGADFAKLAKKYSIDTSTNNKNGDLGLLTKNSGVMIPELEDTIFNMQIKDINLIKSSFGYHIIKLNKIIPSITKNFTAVKKQLIENYTKEQAQKKFYTISDELATLTYESSLQVAAEKLNLAIQSSNFFAKNSTTYNKKFINASFSNEVINNNEIKIVEINDEKIVAIKKNKFINAKPEKFDKVALKIKNLLLQQKTAALNTLFAKNIIQTTKAKWSKDIWVNRNNTDLSSEVINFIFTMKKPTKNKVTYAYTNTLNGLIIIRLTATKITKNISDDYSYFTNIIGDTLFANIIKYLRSNTEIKIFNDLL